MMQDRIERVVTIPVDRERVWAALTEREGLRSWFCRDVEIDLRPGGLIHFHWETIDDCDAIVAAVEPPARFAYRWHPGSVQDRTIPIAEQPLTLVEFTLEPVPDGTRLTLVESGFAALPASIYERVFAENARGWDEELANLAAACTAATRV